MSAIVMKNLVKGLSVDERNGDVYVVDAGEGNAKKSDKFINIVNGSIFPIGQLTYIEGDDGDGYIIPNDMSDLHLSDSNKVIKIPGEDYLIDNWKLESAYNGDVSKTNRGSKKRNKIIIKENFRRSKNDSTPVDAAKATINSIIPLELEGTNSENIKILEGIVKDIENNSLDFNGLFYLLRVLSVKSELVIGGKNSKGVSMAKLYVDTETV